MSDKTVIPQPVMGPEHLPQFVATSVPLRERGHGSLRASLNCPGCQALDRAIALWVAAHVQDDGPEPGA